MQNGYTKKLGKLAPKMTQAEAARALGISRAYVSQIALRERIRFLPRHRHIPVRRCRRCALPASSTCLRCRWTPTRIRRLRLRFGLSQVALSQCLGFNVWAVQRWESSQSARRPSLRALEALERAERALRA